MPIVDVDAPPLPYECRRRLCGARVAFYFDFCEDCAADSFTCIDCGDETHPTDTEYNGPFTHERRCQACGDHDAQDCHADCCGECDCAECETYSGDDDDDCADGSYLHSYSFRPRPNFLSTDAEANASLFLGIELEVPARRPGQAAQRIAQQYSREETMLYCKEDSSIDGVEIVTHPMTHSYFRTNFPFAMLADDELGMSTPDSGYGLHVHVSRAGFAGQAHRLRWLRFVYANRDAVRAIARRDDGSWSSFRDGDPEMMRHKARGGYQPNRYVAVNAQNEATFEVRCFQSTIDVQELRAAVDFVHASVEYTRNPAQIGLSSRRAMDWPAFAAWIDTRAEYSALVDELSELEIGD